MPGSPDYVTDLLLQLAVSQAHQVGMIPGQASTIEEGEDDDEEVGASELKGLQPTGIGVRRRR